MRENIGKNGRRCRGFAMLEILITVVILSIGMIGIAALQTSSMRGTHTAYLRSQATALGHEVADSMRANLQSAKAGDYNTSFDDEVSDLSCASPGMLAAADLCVWKRALESRLPQGRGSLVVGANGLATVCVRWSQPGRSQSISASSDACVGVPADRRQFEFQTVL